MPSLVVELLPHETVGSPHAHQLHRALHPPGEHDVCRVLKSVQLMVAKVLAVFRVSFVNQLSERHGREHPG